MRYAEILSNAISQSGLSLSQIAGKVAVFGIGINKGYLSQLQNGKTNPASDELNRVLATVLSKFTDITYEELRLAAYREKIPEDVLDALVAEKMEQIERGT